MRPPGVNIHQTIWKGIKHAWQVSLTVAWHLGHLHENLLIFCFTFHWITLCTENSTLSSLQSEPLPTAVSGLTWGHVLEDFPGYLPLWGCLSAYSSPFILPPLFFREEWYPSKDFLLWQLFKVGLHILSMTLVPLGLENKQSLIHLLSRKAENERVGNSPNLRTRFEHRFLLFHPWPCLL